MTRKERHSAETFIKTIHQRQSPSASSFFCPMPQLLSFLGEARPLALHFVSTIFSVIVALFLIDSKGGNHVFNLDHRQPHFIDLHGRPRVASIKNSKLLQSDITSLFSLLASATGAAAAWWAGDLLWRCAFLFMEKSEITLAGFSKVISGGITTLLSPYHVSGRKNWSIIYPIIFTCFLMDYFSAIITGSITWQPSFTLVDGVVPLTHLPEVKPESNISIYRGQPLYVSQAIELAASLALISWGAFNTNSSDLELPSNLARHPIVQVANFQGIQYLPPNSTLGTIRLPYFKVGKFEYITDPESTLTSQQWSLLNDSSPYNPYLIGTGFAAFFPDSSASWGPGTNLSLPSAVTVSESRILGLNLGSAAVPDKCTLFLDSFTVPQNINPYPTVIANTTSYSCFVFANVTYTAGAAICQDYKIVSPTVVEGNINKLQPVPDPLAIEALSIAPSVATHILYAAYQADPVISDFSTPLENIGIESISRAYQAAWSSLVFSLSDVGQDNWTNVMVAVSASQPTVLRWRVYVWAALHITVLLGGIAFIYFYFQSRFHHPWVSDPMTAAFLADTTGIFGQDEAADAMDPWHPDAEYPTGMLKLNDYDPNRPGKPRTVVLIPTRTPPPLSPQELKGESDVSLA